MNTLRARLPWIVGVVAVVFVSVLTWKFTYIAKRDDIQGQIDDVRANISGMDSILKGEFDVRSRAKKIGATTLASKMDTLEHRFRAGLSRIGEQEGLAGVVVDDAVSTDQMNPVLQAKGVPNPVKSALRKSADFQVVRGSLKGSGSLEQVLRAIAVVQAQSWVHRVEGFSIRPQGAARDKFELRMDVATLFAPDLAGRAEVDTTHLASVGSGAEPMWRAVVEKNVFRKPTPAQPRPVEIAQAPPAGTPPPEQIFAPYEEWKLTGIFVGGKGTLAFFTNLKTGAKVTVERGGTVLDAVFVEGSGEKVVIEIAGKKFELSNGQTLAARRPLS